jgi:hypothetical protein
MKGEMRLSSLSETGFERPGFPLSELPVIVWLVNSVARSTGSMAGEDGRKKSWLLAEKA